MHTCQSSCHTVLTYFSKPRKSVAFTVALLTCFQHPCCAHIRWPPLKLLQHTINLDCDRSVHHLSNILCYFWVGASFRGAYICTTFRHELTHSTGLPPPIGFGFGGGHYMRGDYHHGPFRGHHMALGSQYMDAEEIDSILRIQWKSLHSGSPYAEDYYYLVSHCNCSLHGTS